MAATLDGLPAAGELPELANVHWRERAGEQSLRRADRVWTLSLLAHEIPFLTTAVLLPLLAPVLAVVSVFALGFAWVIPALYASRGAGVMRPQRRRAPAGDSAEQRALGLLGDLVGHEARALVTRTGLVVEPGAFGAWVVGPAGALLVRPGGRRVQCYCVRVADAELPSADRVAHLLLALRADESGFATVANLTFSGACWRLRRHLSPEAREGLAAGVAASRREPTRSNRAQHRSRRHRRLGE
jgi:hypothetical protein